MDAEMPAGAEDSIADHQEGVRGRDAWSACIGLLVLPFAVGLVWAFRQRWVPGQDRGLIELSVLDVGGGDTPLLGAYSRYGWRHPGPWGSWLLAVPYRLLGTGHGLLPAALVVNLAWLAAVAVACRRHLPAFVSLGSSVVLLALVHGYGGSGLADPWNPWMALAPGLAAVVAAALATERNLLSPVAVGAAAVAVQQHVGYLPLAVSATALALWPVLRGRAPRRLVALSLAVLVAAWAPVAWEAATNPGLGNVGKLAQEVRGIPADRLEIDGTPTERVSPGLGLRLFAREFGLRGSLFTHSPGVDEVGAVDQASLWPVVFPLGFLALGLLARGATPGARRMWATSTGYLAVTAAGYLLLQGTPYPYLLAFGAPAAFLMALTTIWLVGERLADVPHLGVAAAAAALGASAVLSSAAAVGITRSDPPEAGVAAAATATAGPVVERLSSHGHERVAILPRTDPTSTGLRVAVERAGIEANTTREACIVRVVANPDGDVAPRRTGEIARWSAPPGDRPPGSGDLERFFNNRRSIVVVAGPGC